MRLSKIVFPTDFSHASDAALGLAASLARDAGGRLLIVHVEEPPIAYGGGELYYGAPNPDPDELKRMLEQVKPADPNVPYEHHLLAGDPALAIVDFAREQQADLIVMGTHGRTGVSRLLMGSVTEAVVRRAPCPVLTLRQPDSPSEDAGD